jgi:succinyl-diaminopimelate desuccinylase
MNQVVELLAELVRQESTPNNPENNLKCLRFVKKFLLKSGVNSTIGINDGKSYLISGSPTANLLLLGHIDVVPGGKDLFIPRISGNKMFGRGTFDMKGPVADMIDAFLETKKL